MAAARGLATEAAGLVLEDDEPQGQWFWAAVRARIARGLLEQGLGAHAQSLLVPAHASLVAQLGAEHACTVEAGRLLAQASEPAPRP